MNVTEIRKLIRQAEDKSWYRALTIDIVYPHANFEIQLKGLDSMYQFFVKQHDYFDNNEPLPGILLPTKNHYKNCIKRVEKFVNYYLKTRGPNKEVGWKNLKAFCERVSYNNESYFNKESATTDFLLKLDSEFPGASKGAYDFFTNQIFKYNNSDKNYFIGWHRAYEFFTQDADFVKRRNNEKNTLSRLRSEYVKIIDKTDKEVDEHIAEKEKFYKNKERAITRLIKKKNTEYVKWESDNKAKYENFLLDSDNKFEKLVLDSNASIKNLEALYNEKLKLEAPAKYWKDRATKLRGEGDKWLYWLIGCTVIAVISLAVVLYFISDGTLKELFENTGSAIRWSIVFITFVSFLAYAIRTFAKLMFSAYHLHRDAEEREQLAYVYLALKKEQGIDDTERQLVMQSIFSRADSGLLKDESSPTMPGGSMLEKIIGGSK